MAPNLATSPDFWLPERLAKLGTFIELERNTYAEFNKIVKDWLARIREPILRPGGVPGIDPHGVHAGAMAWNRGIETFTTNAIVPILGRAYADNFDGNFPFTHRPFYDAHIETVENRLVRIPDEVFNQVRDVLREGVDQGHSIPEISARIQTELLDSGSDTWRNRATVIARTETIGAYNAGTNDAFEAVAEVLEVPMEKVWLATDDDRTRHTHREADGQRVPLDSTFTVGGASLDFPGDPTGPPQEVIQCRCTMLLVEPGEALDMSDRQLLASAGPAFVEPTTLGHALLASGLPVEWAVIDGWDHSLCVLEFCRAPLHPGPCKGWKHTLKQIAPGVYDALERVRVAKLEEKRKAKIAALKAAGKPIPKALLKPIKPAPDPKPPPATPGTVGVPPMVGTEAPLSPATEAKLTAVSAKVKKEFDPETVKAKKAAKAKAHKLAQAEAMSKMAAQQKAEKEKKDAEAAKAKADAEAAAPPVADSDTPSAGFIPTDEQAAAIAAAEGKLDTENTIDAYTDLDPDDFAELAPHIKAKILANIAMLAHSDALTPLEQGKLKGKYHDLTGKLPQKPADSPKVSTVAEKVAAPDPPAQPDTALAKAEQIVANAGKKPDVELLQDIAKLSKAEFDTLPPHAKAKVLAELQDIANNEDTHPDFKILAKALYEDRAGQKMGAGTPPAAPDSPAVPDQPNITAVPEVPNASEPTPNAAKAAKIAKTPGATKWKDRLAAYTALTQADVDSMSPEDLDNIQADLDKLHTWYQKKNLKVGAKAVKDLSDGLATKADAGKSDDLAPDEGLVAPPAPSAAEMLEALETPSAPPPAPSPTPGSPDWEDQLLTPSTGQDAPSVTPPPAPEPAPAPVLNLWQQDVVNAVETGETTALLTPLTPTEYKGLPAATKLKLAKALADLDNPAAHKLYEQYFGTPHPKAGHATSTDPAPTPEPDTPTLPTSPPKNTFQEWQNAKAGVGSNYKGKNKQVADAIKGGHFTTRLAKYDTYVKDKATFQKMPPELRAAMIADLDNIALNAQHFTPEHAQLAAELRERFTGKPPGAEWTAPTTGQPKKFSSQAAEKAHNVALNPGLHSTQERLNAYKKLSAVGFKSLPPETQQAISQDLNSINGSVDASVLESNQALSTHLKLTGQAIGDDFTPLTPSPAKKKFSSPEAEAAYEAAKNGKPLGYYSTAEEHTAKYDAYAGLSKEEFDKLPSTVQKQIFKDLGAMTLSKSPLSNSQVEALKTKLGINGWNWKPTTAGSKKLQEAKAKTAAQVTEAATNYQASTAGKTFKEKEAEALSNYDGLNSAPLRLVGGAGGPANMQAQPPVNGVTGQQMHNAVTTYKGSAYASINGALRNAKGGPISASSHTTAAIRGVDAAMEASRLPAPVAMWRGAGSGYGVFGDALNGVLTDIEFTEHGYASTSASRGTANGFAGHGGLIMRALVPPGIGAVRVSGNEYESELLLERGLRWRVVADHGHDADGYRRIDVEVVPHDPTS